MDSDVPRLTIGMEEEYFVVDRDSRDLVPDLPDSLLAKLGDPPVGATSPEFIRSQVEIGTPVSGDITELSEHLCTMRRFVSDTVSEHNMAIIASSTHPFAEWGSQRHVNKRRYNILAEALQGVVRRLLICGMHVHIGIDDEDQRIDMMNQVSYFLPHLLALSGSSPFWHGEDTGLKSYRPAIFRALPRTGLPDEFLSWSDYRRHVDVLVDTGVIEDASKLWWDIRPSDRYPTLEMRSADICTRYEDGITIAAVYQAIIAMLHHRRMNNQKWRIYSRMLISENSWRAQRYGVDEPLIDFGRSELVSMDRLMDELVDVVRDHANALGSLRQVERVKEIVAEGTSADRQRGVFENAISDGADPREALRVVVDHLIVETVEGL
ncbi:MAG: carboxylate-amine ligase [Actinobacteria bacterium]|nr:MAG: carboxylate-amine ligase [Actinomycetota bacterium]